MKKFKLDIKSEYDRFCEMEKERYTKLAKDYDTQVKKWQKEVIESEIKCNRELSNFKTQLALGREQMVWKYINEHGIITKFIDLAKKENKKQIQDDRNERLKVLSEVISQQRKEKVEEMMKEVELERKNMLKDFELQFVEFMNNREVFDNWLNIEYLNNSDDDEESIDDINEKMFWKALKNYCKIKKPKYNLLDFMDFKKEKKNIPNLGYNSLVDEFIDKENIINK